MQTCILIAVCNFYSIQFHCLSISICLCLMCLQEGGVFTCGSGAHGQLGHGNTFSASRLRMIFELMGTAVSQVVCGRCMGGERVEGWGGEEKEVEVQTLPVIFFAVLIVSSA